MRERRQVTQGGSRCPAKPSPAGRCAKPESLSRQGSPSARAANAAQGVAPERFAAPPALDPRQRLLLRGGTIVSLDPQIGNLATGDVLIEGKTIAAIGPNLSAAGAQVIDAANMILIPGFVDCHRHSWEGQLRRINPNAQTLAEYSNATHLSFATHYRPQDTYVGNLLTAFGCIDAGITCVIDNSHNSRSAAHSDAAVEALIDSGIRAVHASGAPQAGTWDQQWPRRPGAAEGQIFPQRRPARDAPDVLTRQPRQLGARAPPGPQDHHRIPGAERGDAAGPDVAGPAGGRRTIASIIAARCPSAPGRSFANSGATINVCPRSDAQYGLGEGIAAYQHALDHGIRPGFSVDNETSYSTDMFAEMRVAFMMQRALAPEPPLCRRDEPARAGERARRARMRDDQRRATARASRTRSARSRPARRPTSS